MQQGIANPKFYGDMSRVVRKPAAFCICENKEADQLRGNREADQRLCFRYTDSTIHLLPTSEISRSRFVSDLVGNPENRFSHNEAHISSFAFSSTLIMF